MKNVDVQVIRDASLAISADHTYTTTSYTWAPVIDDKFLLSTLTEATTTPHHRSHAIKTDHILATYNTHEGEDFIPPGLAYKDPTTTNSTNDGFNSSTASFHSWLSGFLPDLPPAEIHELETRFYPPNGHTETLDLYKSTFVRAGLVYRDVVLACPAYWLAGSAREEGYLAEYTIEPARHASDTVYVRSDLLLILSYRETNTNVI